MVNKSIGGYFELELPKHNEYHAGALALNSGRACLEYILRRRKYSKVYLPYFTCDTVLEPILKLGIDYCFYHIDTNYYIVDDITLGDNEAIIYTNYWGLCSELCFELSKKYHNQLILDYTQAFFARPIDGIDTFYSCRKFFGVADGGYLYIDKYLDIEIEQDLSYMKVDPLIKRIDISPEAGYADFRKCSDNFHNSPIYGMSKFTRRMMQSIDYENVANRRQANYDRLRKLLGGRILSENEVPMIFPFQSAYGQNIRNHLIKNRIYVAKYWPNVRNWAGESAKETWMAEHILALPIDQRYDDTDMLYIYSHIENAL